MTKCFSGEKINELIEEIDPKSVVSTNLHCFNDLQDTVCLPGNFT